MEGDEMINLLLGRAAKLRFKISDAIGLSTSKGAKSEEDDKRGNRLLGIQDALRSLEKELASLKDLHQRQRHEMEASLTKFNHSRMKMLMELEDYKGEDLEVIHEAATIASETVPTLLPELTMANDNYSSHFHSTNKLSIEGLTVDSSPENTKDSESQREHLAHSARQNKQKVMRFVLGLIAKSAITFVGVISVLNLAGFKPEIRKRDTSINLFEFFSKTAGGREREVSTQCPPGKILVVEDGKARCLVKERIEIPFGSDFDSSNINFAFG